MYVPVPTEESSCRAPAALLLAELALQQCVGGDQYTRYNFADDHYAERIEQDAVFLFVAASDIHIIETVQLLLAITV